ncbi:MAG: hypothetical protein IJ220_09170 [Clostridia bacterium]|nr:hypothetical protein [Clostridia bacterium]
MKMAGRNLNMILRKAKSRRLRRIVAFILITLFIIYRGTFSLLLMSSNIAVTAHRGSTTVAPENTVSSVLEAIALGADYIEIDVQLTKDGEVILLHDTNFKRVAGIMARPSELTYEEILDLNVGAYKTELEFHAPLLREVLDVCLLSSTKLNIELKDYRRNARLPYEVVRIIEEYDFLDRCVITSYSQDFLKTVKRLCPKIQVGLITNSSSLTTYIENRFVDFYSINYLSLSPSIVMYIHAKHKEVFCWTPSSRIAIETAIRAGADNIITNNVALAQLLIVSHN